MHNYQGTRDQTKIELKKMFNDSDFNIIPAIAEIIKNNASRT